MPKGTPLTMRRSIARHVGSQAYSSIRTVETIPNQGQLGRLSGQWPISRAAAERGVRSIQHASEPTIGLGCPRFEMVSRHTGRPDKPSVAAWIGPYRANWRLRLGLRCRNQGRSAPGTSSTQPQLAHRSLACSFVQIGEGYHVYPFRFIGESLMIHSMSFWGRWRLCKTSMIQGIPFLLLTGTKIAQLKCCNQDGQVVTTIAAGWSNITIQELLRHVDVRSTMSYAHSVDTGCRPPKRRA